MKLSGQEFEVSEMDKLSGEIYELQQKKKQLQFELDSEYDSDKYKEQKKSIASSGATYNLIVLIPVTCIAIVCIVLLFFNGVDMINAGASSSPVVRVAVMLSFLGTIISMIICVPLWKKQITEMRDADSQVDKRAEIKARLRSQISSIDIKIEELENKKKVLEETI